MKKGCYILLITIGLFACTKEVEIDIPGYEEQLVIDGVIETGMPPFVMLSKSKDIYAPTDLDAFLNGYVSGATITVSDGTTQVVLEEWCSDNLPAGTEQLAADMLGIPVSELANYHICAYLSTNPAIFGQVGKTYYLTVENEGKTYTAQTDILPPTPLDSVYWKPEGASTTHGFSWAHLTDPPAEGDNYKWEIKRINTGPDGNPIDQNFTETYNPVFNDDFFNGLAFEFYYENPYAFGQGIPDDEIALYPIGDTVVIKFSKMDDAVYEFLEKKYMQLSTAGNPFATPTNIPNNISGGALGVWAGFSPSFDTLICQP